MNLAPIGVGGDAPALKVCLHSLNVCPRIEADRGHSQTIRTDPVHEVLADFDRELGRIYPGCIAGPIVPGKADASVTTFNPLEPEELRERCTEARDRGPVPLVAIVPTLGSPGTRFAAEFAVADSINGVVS